MIPVDTNVMPEPLRREPNAAVIEWLDAQNVETLYLAAISLAELRFGVAALPEGRRRDWLQQSIGQRVLPLFRGRILPFDDAASRACEPLRADACRGQRDRGRRWLHRRDGRGKRLDRGHTRRRAVPGVGAAHHRSMGRPVRDRRFFWRAEMQNAPCVAARFESNHQARSLTQRRQGASVSQWRQSIP